MQQGFDMGLGLAAPDPPAAECCRDDLRLVEDQDVAGLEQRRQIPHTPILKAMGLDHEELCRIAGSCGPQRNAIIREIEIEIRDAHGTPRSTRLSR